MPRCSQPSPKLLTIAILAVLPALSAYAGPQQVSPPPSRDRGQQDESRQDRGQSRGDNSLSDAVRRVERDTRGEVLSAERVQFDGRDMHRVKVVDDEGRVRVFMQDPSRRNDNSRSDNGRRSDNRRNDNTSGSRQGDDRGNGSRRREPPTRDEDD